MKQTIWLFGILVLTLCGCSQTEENALASCLVSSAEKSVDTHISEIQALQIASAALEGANTRSAEEVLSVEYVVFSGKTRSTNLPDTLAYVINYPNDGGFAIISADSRVEPLLAYSETGHIDVADEFVKENILTPTEEYLLEHLPQSDVSVPTVSPDLEIEK